MKIIQSPVPALPRELPSELERLTMWLLVKDPNGRPTIRDILNESKIREKLFEYQYNLPEDLLRCEVTDRLTGVTPSAGAGGRRTSRTTSSLPPPLPEPPKVSSSSSAGGNRLRGSNVHGVRSPSDRVSLSPDNSNF